MLLAHIFGIPLEELLMPLPTGIAAGSMLIASLISRVHRFRMPR